ncbi:type VI secretion system protein TssA [Litchfieldella rifensis]|uniref:Type VI secretion system protein TssA n=1 Tax=Litchfieldella rifensis TaxID=762643 RepID=A0ABV7LNS9_9GAMM
MQITTEAHLEPLLAPLEAGVDGQRVGRPVDDSADYAWLDEEMMKIGSLQHGTVDWEGAETRAVRLLSETGKDLKVLGHLLHCLQRGGDGVRFALSLHLLAGSLERWWDQAHPVGGPRGARVRPRLFQQFTQRAVTLAAALDFKAAEEEHEACQAALEALLTVTRARELPEDALVELQRCLQDVRPRHDAPPAPPSATASGSGPAPETAGRGGTAATAKMPEMRLEAGNERGNRQTLLKMADFLNEQAPGEALGYRLRRHAIWGAIQAPPATRDGERTELAPVSADRAAEYRDALARGGDIELWRRIENSLAVSPYWLEGHRLSATLAKALGHARCAESIRDEAARFVARLPGIESLTFNDGSPFVDGETLRWLQSASSGTAGMGHGGGGDAWQTGLDEARECLATEGLEAALTILDRGLAAARSPRDDAYWRLASADLLREAGLEALARQHYRALHQAVADIGLELWEPGLLSRLEASLKA